jgi:hypothetical protein
LKLKHIAFGEKNKAVALIQLSQADQSGRTVPWMHQILILFKKILTGTFIAGY